jgi:hypothetical protein
MTIVDVRSFFAERRKEVEAYIQFLEQLDKATQRGLPQFKGSRAVISADQQKILYSSIYLQLYNLVEATVSQCLAAVSEAASDGTHRPQELNESLQIEWIKTVARTAEDLNQEHRLKTAIAMYDYLIKESVIHTFQISSGGGGNWDDKEIESLMARLGCRFAINQKISSAAKRHVRDEMGALKLVKVRRNNLAHGSVSFVDCADGVDVGELKSLVKAVISYLQAVIVNVTRFVSKDLFLQRQTA